MNYIDKIFSEDIEKFSKDYFDYLKKVIDSVSVKEVKGFVEILLDTRARGSTIFFIGNGGSAATASHFANDLAFGTNEYEKPFKVMSLAENVAVLTALGNDFGYEEIFVRQLKVYGKRGDVLVGISASGNSPNLLNAFEYASTAGIRTVALTAFDGGKMKSLADQGIHVPTGMKEYGPSEDVHMILNHLVGAYLQAFVKKAIGLRSVETEIN
ncbi:Phosphoheptose isomerase 1 [hydrothermal vent metagenome]|uniref:Phosphoheptose isomerase 1 n=1 Tax=hydrothermal vent metagenome TaxID=652676 RepID=A0A3B0Y780_9ZZZZ